jgi:beta-glucanase (GH16 family)
MHMTPRETIIFNPDFSDPGYDIRNDFVFETGDKWANNEKQCYRDDASHCFVKDGILNIVATKEEGHCRYISSRITTKETHLFNKGTFVVRAKMPKGRGAWPAVWFLGLPKPGEVRKWPDCGEIDLLEFAGNRPGQVTCALHTKAYNHKIGNSRNARIKIKGLDESFHDYKMVWDDHSITIDVDGIVLGRFNRQESDTDEAWPFDKPYYMLLNLAVGGWYGGPVNDDDFPFVFQIASIKVTSSL